MNSNRLLKESPAHTENRSSENLQNTECLRGVSLPKVEEDLFSTLLIFPRFEILDINIERNEEIVKGKMKKGISLRKMPWGRNLS
jgi:hypothetical protein